jgi:ribonuclease D
LHDVLLARLEPMGRTTWAADECEERRTRIRTRPEPELAWWRMKGARQLRGKSRGVAQQVGAWRERTAAALDVPPRFVLSDLALAGIVHRPPRTREELSSIRGVDGRALRDGTTDALLSAVATGLELDPASVEAPASDHLDRALAPAVTVIGAWLSQRAAELELDPAVLATRADLSQLLQGGPSRLATGWRAELVGAPVQRLLRGEASLVLRDGGRRVELHDQ